MKRKKLISRGFTKRMSLEERALALKEGREQRLKELQEADIPVTPKPKRRRISSKTIVTITLFATSSHPVKMTMTKAQAEEHGYYNYTIVKS